MRWPDRAIPRRRTVARRIALLLAALLGALLPAAPAVAGPPYATDDPEPVPLRNWELYLAGIYSAEGGDRAGDAPHVEANYGAAPGLQLHLLVPLAFSRPAGQGTAFGLGDVEVGAKVRFVEETGRRPQVGVFPLVEIPTGNASRGLGSGHVRAFLPLWLQKSVGKWLTYGGGGYWLNPGEGNRSWWFAGGLVQYQATPTFAPGVELFYQTPSEEGGSPELHVNAGFVLDLGEHHHVLFSAGRGIHGCGCDQAYAGYLFTFGPGS